MAQKDSKKRLFEVMARLDKTFKPNLSEGFGSYGRDQKFWSREKNAGDPDASGGGDYYEVENGAFVDVSEYDRDEHGRIINRYNRQGKKVDLDGYPLEETYGTPDPLGSNKAKQVNEDDKWIQKAVNPEHKGYCTPMTKPTCTPARKALAKRFKKGIDEAAMLPVNIDDIVKSYLETAFWSTEEQENGLKEKSIADVDRMSVQGAKKDVIDFLRQAETQAPDELQSYDAEALGHNLWLSRNGHGAGFFDDNNDKLQDIARNMKGVDMYVGDDGKVYISGSEPVDEVSKDLADRAFQGGVNKVVKTYSQQPFDMKAHQKALGQMNKFRDYKNPEENPVVPEQPVDERMIGKKPTGKRDSVTYYKGEGAFPKYTHFAVLKRDNKVLTGWDYRGYDSEELKLDKRHYFYDDIKDMQIDPKMTKVVTTKYLQKLGIDPFNFDNWNKDTSVFTL